MAYQALYRRWRPQTFESVVGQTATVKTLRHQIETGQIAHAYLFCGCRGTGKTTMAKLMSRAINCLNPNHGDPCGKCEVCRAIQTESTMDVLELDAASNNSVDNIRELLEQVRYPAQMGKYKVYIIDEVHMLSTAAFNALLKTLEEPPAHVVFILATTEPQKLAATILSRVQRYDFGRIPSELMIGRMKEALDELHMTADPEALQLVARAAEGAMRDAFSILDMCVAGAENGTITAAQVRDALGTSDREFLFAFLDCIADRDAAGVLRKVDELMRSGREPQVFLKDLSSHCRMLMTVQAVKEGMHNLTTGSLSYYFSNCVVSAGAKTGTAETGIANTNNGVFVCFAPYDDPQIAVAVVIEKGGSGAALASTAVDIVNSYFSQEEIGAVVIGENTLLK